MTQHILYLIRPWDSVEMAFKAGKCLWIPDNVQSVQPIHSSEACAIETVRCTLDGMAEWYAEQIRQDFRARIHPQQTSEPTEQTMNELMRLLKQHTIVVASGYDQQSIASTLTSEGQNGAWRPGEILRIKVTIEGNEIAAAEMGRLTAHPKYEHTKLELREYAKRELCGS